MTTPITKPQSRRINKLVRSLCANCDNGNCLLLDDGESHSCVQLISFSGIYCNYLKTSVLPAEKELYLEIMQKTDYKTCSSCGKKFYCSSKNKKYCEHCATTIKREKSRLRKQKQRSEKQHEQIRNHNG